ncbi:cysteine desulfurase [Hamiltosporidium tvaerminnensis]|uniref:Cysteine desulfurase, mitosomal n=2 Tax=Hamiltosporidium TaxID=1176354 RepID=A0A4Q9LNZ4_9MICR|nr:cysteine desulfurase [Hamiltosporidium tvaerminnensis]TBU05200.1 cysteine desulfurase [Hamiltosporidium tvaerminnensis]TBU09221.1 cysteine desulfurase [Hamiltosporidium magnivora]
MPNFLSNIFKNTSLSNVNSILQPVCSIRRYKTNECKEPKRIYLDFQSTTPLDPRVLDAMLPYYTSKFGNPHSKTHSYGWEAEKAIEKSREQVASVIKADPREIIFTSGATESSNLAIKGVVKFKMQENKPIHIITLQTEHKCVLDPIRNLEAEGCEVTYLKVNKDGLINMDEFKNSIKSNTVLVSVMAVNNEIGVIQPLKEIGQICREKGVLFHTDAAQAFGKMPLDVNDMNIDLMSISGHKIYGPKGIGALYVRRRPRVKIYPLIMGGGQERGLRSGTVPTPLVVGLGKAAEISKTEMKKDFLRIRKMANQLLEYFRKKLKDVTKNSVEDNLESDIENAKVYPGCLNISFSYVEGEGLLMSLKNIALSSGSACTSSSLEPSFVLRALGTDEDLAHSSIRFGMGRFTTEKEIKEIAKKTVDSVKNLRKMSPLYEMVKEGIDLKTINWTE